MNQESREYITHELDKLVEPYLVRDLHGKIREEFGYLRRGNCWPKITSKVISWGLFYEMPPVFESSSQILLEFYPEAPKEIPILKPRFYVNYYYIGFDLEEVFSRIKKELNQVHQRNNEHYKPDSE